MSAVDTLKPGAPYVAAPADVNLTGGACKYLVVGGAGTLVVMNPAGDIVPFENVPAGKRFDIQAIQVRAATTATEIWVYYG